MSCCRRTLRLFLISSLLLGSQISYDALAAVAPYLKKQRGIGGKELGGLYAAYHAPNIFVCLVAGLLIDQVGAANMALVLSVIVLSSCCLFAAASQLGMMVLSRLLLGVGSEALNVAQMALLSASFGTTGNPSQAWPSLAVSYGVALLVMRVAVLISFQVLPVLVEAVGWAGMWSVAGAAGVSVVAAAALLVMGAERTVGTLDEALQDGRAHCCCSSCLVAPRSAPFGRGGALARGKEGASDIDDIVADVECDEAAAAREPGERSGLLQRSFGDSSVGGSHATDRSTVPRSPSVAVDARARTAAAADAVTARLGDSGACSAILRHARRTTRRTCSCVFALSTVLLLLYSGTTMPFGEYSVDLYASPVLGSYSPVAAARVASLSTFVGLLVTLPL
jgi:hypothetical protein